MSGAPSVALLLELGLILAVLSALGALARRFALTPVPLYLLVGLALGEGGIAPVPAAAEFVEIGASIGVVLLLLTLGLEFSVEEFTASLHRHLPSAVVDLVLNATPGAVAGWLFGLGPIGILALAGATWVSSSGIVARMLDDLGRVGNRETPAVLSVLVLEDFAMAAYLPLLTVLAAGGAAWQAGLGMPSPSPRDRRVRRHPTAGALIGRMLTHPEPEQLLLRVLGVTLLVAGLAELVGASAAVGAFLVGLTLTGPVAARAAPSDPAARPVRRRVLPRHRTGHRPRRDITRAAGRARRSPPSPPPRSCSPAAYAASRDRVAGAGNSGPAPR